MQPARRPHPRALAVAAATVAALFLSATPFSASNPPRATELLDHYLSGSYGSVVQELSAQSEESKLDDLLDDLKSDGAAWIDAGGASERNRRELAAATVALEAARAGEWRDWKIRRRMPLPPVSPGVVRPPAVSLFWQAPALLVEWGCALMRQGHQPRAVERDWFLASVAVAERSEDYEFMVGDTKLDEMARRNLYEYSGDVIQHIRQARIRFPDEPRFKLAQGIAEETHDPAAAVRQFELLRDDVDLRGEAAMRLGVIAYRQRDEDRALSEFQKVESLTRDPWVLYLSRLVTGLVQERRLHFTEAELAYRRALTAAPYAEAVSVSLAGVLFRSGRRDEASAVIGAMLAADPAPPDPWRGYADADDRFWPELIGRLRTEMRQ